MKHLNLTILALLISLLSFGQVAPITGPSAVCVGYTVTMTDATPGGTWNSSNPTIATINTTTGVATGISPGVTTISYTVGITSVTTSLNTVPTPSAPTGPSTVCVGTTITLIDGIVGGMWSSSSPAVASVDPAGVVTGNSVGIANITYTLGTGCSAIKTVTVTPTTPVFTVTGGGGYCAGGTGMHIGLSGSSAGSSYQLYNGITAVGAPVTGTGLAIDFGTFTAAGTYTVTGNPGTSCATAMTGSVTITINPLPAAYTVTGGGTYCSGGAGVPVGISNSNIGINYQLYLGGVPVGAPVAGFGLALNFGLQTAAGTYTVVAIDPVTTCANNMTGSAIISITPTVVPSVSNTAVPGTSVCTGTSVTYTAVPVNGGPTPTYAWTVNGVAAGTGTTYSYIPASGDIVAVTLTSDAICASPTTATTADTMTVTTPVTPTVTINASPGTTICSGTMVTFSNTNTYGGLTPTFLWSVNGTPMATGPTYVYFPADGDVVSVTMTSSFGCLLTTTATDAVTMHFSVPTVTATATSSGCGGAIDLTATGGVTYSWSPSTGLACPTCATNNFVPASTVTYVVTATDGYGCTGNATVVVDGNRISGFITYTGTPSTDTFKVWLIHFNPSDSSITALDSTVNCVYPGTPYYEFMGKSSGNYMVKAKLLGGVPGTSGYIPTYGVSASHWDSAATIIHTAGTADSMHINMIYGTVPSGPGFIGGFVYSGAGKGTTGEVPVTGMLIYLKDASGTTLTYTYTGADGSYSFSGIANGSYLIYPEDYKYRTTPSSLITLSTTAESIDAVNFKEHTSYGTITPYDNTKVHQAVAATGISIFPNPASGEMNIQWENKTTGTANVVITDMIGREMMKTSLQINTATGLSQIDLSTLNEGVYMISVKGTDFNFSARLVRIKG